MAKTYAETAPGDWAGLSPLGSVAGPMSPLAGQALRGRGVVARNRMAGPPRAGGAVTTFTYGGGPLLVNVHVHLIFWGTAWMSTPAPTPSMGEVTNAVSSIVTGPYMQLLGQYSSPQYGSIGAGQLSGITLVSTAVGNSPADPPAMFTDPQVTSLIHDLIWRNLVPNPNDRQLLYCVVMPRGVASSLSTPTTIVNGEHAMFEFYSFPLSWTPVHWAWVTNDGTLDGVTRIFSHELAEACTDPEGDGWTDPTGSAPGCLPGFLCEIGDRCEAGVVGGNAFAVINGVSVQRYWSRRDNTCGVATDKNIMDKTLKDNKDSPDQKQAKDHKDFKDRKEGKDGAKDKDFKEAERPDVGDLPTTIGQLAQRVDQISQQVQQISQVLASGRAFIRPEERPEVGEQALGEPEERPEAGEQAPGEPEDAG